MVEVMPVMRILVGIVLLLSSSCVLAANKNDLGKVFVVSSKDRKKSIELPFDFNSPVSDLRVVILNPDNCSKLGISCGKELILKLNGRKLDGNTSLSDQHYRPGQAVVVEEPSQSTTAATEQSDESKESQSAETNQSGTDAGTHVDSTSPNPSEDLAPDGSVKEVLNMADIMAERQQRLEKITENTKASEPESSNSGDGSNNQSAPTESEKSTEEEVKDPGMAPGAIILIVLLIVIIVIGIFCLIDFFTNDGEYVKKYANQAVALFGGAALTATAVTTTSQSVPGEGIIDPVVSAVSGIDLGLVLAITIPATILVFTIVVLLLEFFNVIHIEFVASVLDGMKNLGRVGLSKISVSNSVAVKTSSDMSNSAISDDPDSNDIDLESGRAQ
eukprot:5329_1